MKITKYIKFVFPVLIVISYLFLLNTSKVLTSEDKIDSDYKGSFSASKVIVGKDIEPGFYDILIEDGSSVSHNEVILYKNTTVNVPLNQKDHLKIKGKVTIKSVDNAKVNPKKITESGYYLLEDFSTLELGVSKQRHFNVKYEHGVGELSVFSSYQSMFYENIYILKVDFHDIYQNSKEDVLYLNIPKGNAVEIKEVEND